MVFHPGPVIMEIGAMVLGAPAPRVFSAAVGLGLLRSHPSRTVTARTTHGELRFFTVLMHGNREFTSPLALAAPN